MRPGHKPSEVGPIPEEWEVKPLGDIFEFSGGFTASREQLSTEGLCYLHYGDIHKSAKTFIDVQTEFLDIPKLNIPLNQVPARSILADGDVVFVDASEDDAGTSKHVVVLNQPAIPYISGLHTIVAKSKDSSLDNRFKQYCFQTADIRRQFYFYAVGTKVSGISKTNIPKLVLPIPSLTEQRAIAAALAEVDKLLSALTLLIAKKRDLKQAAMQQLLTGQTRLQGFSGAWELIPLARMVKSEKFAIVDGPFGTQMKVEEYVSIGVAVVEMEHLNDGTIDQRIQRCITPKKFEELKRSAVYPGDIVISKTGSLGYLGIIPDSLAKGIITSRLAKISLDASRADRSFIFQYLLKLRRDGYWEKVSQGGTMQILGIGMLQNAPIPNISVPEQIAIAEVLSDMDAELAALTQRRDKTRALKQGMMQELLTGRTRLA